MAQLSAFDVLGPNMIGPSSSHTAGAAVIAYLAQKMINGPIIKATFPATVQTARFEAGYLVSIQMTNVSGILSESHPNAALNIILYRMTPSPIFTQTLWIS